ncbi:chymotrypsinogen 2-like [Aquarana catesbeiana]|uniref:chymotrypsinogen 2-like n=1 Tax=Aquarana catesbeiana TaxID=8400 RepID=UPI003CC9AF65
MSILWVLSCLVLLSGAYGFGIPVIRPLISGYERPVNGKNIVPGFGPWHKYIQTNPQSLFCGGSIIKKLWVVTAAHCGPTYVEVGELPLVFPEIDIKSLSYIIAFEHPEYNSETSTNDIALIKLSSPLTINEDVSLVSLASVSDTVNKGDNCVTIKSGYTSDSKATSEDSQEVTVPILTSDECQKLWGTKSQRNTICTGVSSCMVDRGAGLLCERNGTKILAGIASSSCSTSKPAIFTDISIYRDWIDQTIQDN